MKSLFLALAVCGLGGSAARAEEIKPVCGSTQTIMGEDYAWCWTDNRFIEWGPRFDSYQTALFHFEPSSEVINCPASMEKDPPDAEMKAWYKKRGEEFTPHWKKWKKIPYHIEWSDTYISTSSHKEKNHMYMPPEPFEYDVPDRNIQLGIKDDGSIVWRERK